MKRLITLVLALCMIFALAACGGGTKTMECEECGRVKECSKVTYELNGKKNTEWLCESCEKVAKNAEKLFG